MAAVAFATVAGCASSHVAASDAEQEAVLRLLHAVEEQDAASFASLAKSAVFKRANYPVAVEKPRALRMTDVITDSTRIHSDSWGRYRLNSLSTQGDVVTADYECPDDWADCGARMDFIFRKGQIVEVQDVFLGLGG